MASVSVFPSSCETVVGNSSLISNSIWQAMIVSLLATLTVFVTTDLGQAMQKIHSHVQIDIGELQMQSSTTVSYYLTSLVVGNIELRQKMYYQTENLHQSRTGIGGPGAMGNSNGTAVTDSPTTPNSEKEELAKLLASEKASGPQKYVSAHNVKIEYLVDEQVRKIKEDTVVIPCVEEIKLTGRFYTLSREALRQAYRNEDFLLRLNVEVKSPDPIDILETQFVSVSTRTWCDRLKYSLSELVGLLG